MTDQVAQDLAKAVAAVVQGTHEITAVTIKHKREWQRLTDEEIDEGQRQSWVEKQAFESAVWWAEAKLKEKNS